MQGQQNVKSKHLSPWESSYRYVVTVLTVERGQLAEDDNYCACCAGLTSKVRMSRTVPSRFWRL